MKRIDYVTALIAAVAFVSTSPVTAQQPQGPQPYSVGNRVGLPVTPAANGSFEPVSSNVKVFGAIYSAESCSYDADRGVIVVPNRGVPQNVQTNNAWVSFINHDGSVHTARWVGVQNPPERSSLTPPLVLNEPYGSDIANGKLYVADRDGGTTPNGTAAIFVQGAPLLQPNGVAFDAQGNVVVVNIGNDEVLTFSPEGRLVRTEKAAQAGNDGLVIMRDGTKYVSSVVNGGVSRIRSGQPAELIARNIPSAASMCYDAGANQLVIPMNPNNGLAFIRLR